MLLVVFEFVFWASMLILAYTYVGYPLALSIWSVWRKRPVARHPIVPTVSIVIAACDEGTRLGNRIQNCLEQQYPTSHLQVVVVSDGSKDNTESVVRAFDRDRVILVKLPEQMGKAVALNSGVAASRGDIVVFADARQRFAPKAVAELVSNFADSHVGAVSGELVLESKTGQILGIGRYWHFEKWIRRKEAAIDSVIGVTGAIYAIRRDLYKPLSPGTILDDLLIPMRIAMQGYRVVFDQRALAFEPLAPDYDTEFRRKVRTLAGNYQAMSLCPDLIKPWRNRLFMQFVSHKVCRLAAPFCLITLLIFNLVLLNSWYVYLLAIQVSGYVMAIVGWGLQRVGIQERWTSAAFTFCFLNYAALIGAIRFFRRDQSLWNKPGVMSVACRGVGR